MGSLIHGWVEFQISAIVTVCWWVEQDWKWLPWQPVRTSTNLKIYFESMLSCFHWQIVLVVRTCLFLLFYDTHWWLQCIQIVSKLCIKCQPVCCDLTLPCLLLSAGKTKIHISTFRIIYGHSKRNWQPHDYFRSLKPGITHVAKNASI